jgi:hypothetical protein
VNKIISEIERDEYRKKHKTHKKYSVLCSGNVGSAVSRLLTECMEIIF